MDIKESIKKLIRQSTELLNKLEADESMDDDIDDDDFPDDDVEIFDQIIEDSKAIATKLEAKRSAKPRLNGNSQSTTGDDNSDSSTQIKLVPIDKLIGKSATIVLAKTLIELSDSDNEVLARSAKPKSDDVDQSSSSSSSKASILKNVFHPVKEIATKTDTHVNRSGDRTRYCSVNLPRSNLSRLAGSKGLELMSIVNDASTPKPTTTTTMTTTKALRIDDSSEEKEEEEDCKATQSHRTNGSKSNSRKIAKNSLNLSSSEGEDDCTNDKDGKYQGLRSTRDRKGMELHCFVENCFGKQNRF